MKITIEKLTERDWRVFSEIRLRALQNDPHVFGSNYEREARFSEIDWRSRLQAKDNAIFLLRDDETPIGITCVSIDRTDPTGKTALLWGSWLAPEARGKGLSKLMYQTRIEWALRHPAVEKIVVSHRASNLASQRANQKHDFVFTHEIKKTWIDGATENEVFYELKINR